MADIIFKKIEEAKAILKELGLPKNQQNEISALTLLALCDITPDKDWKNSQRISLKVTKGIMTFVNDNYNKHYAPNTRETFRRQVLHQFVQAKIVNYNPDNTKLAVNSPNAHYAVSIEALQVIKSFGTKKWASNVEQFKSSMGSLDTQYRKERKQNLVAVKLSTGKTLKLSPGKHNEIQAAVIEQFAPRFASGAIVLYLGDTANKNLHIDKKYLKTLNIPVDRHSKLPDVIIYDEKRNWLYLIEVVTSHGPVSPKRFVELEELLINCKAGKIYVTAFPDFKEFKKHTLNIAWETEVWVAEIPDHMIHFNGDKFIGPR
ncbi:MAG TPA: BsuBI/PstI family type II restriction endonuclease [Bacteroidia bacterium]|nr:BsuBI/PstI family type II restriction endonuclease [Bacteroidia bacterium]